MNPNTLQTISQIVIATGIVLTALGGFGSYYFGKIKDSIKDEQAQIEIDQAKNERKEIVDILEPFTKIATQKYPNETDSNALTKLATDISNLEKKTKEIEKKITPFSLNTNQKSELIKKLSKYSTKQVIIKRENNPSLQPFVDDLIEIFEKAGWAIIKNEIAIVGSYDGITIFGQGQVNKPLSGFINDLYFGLLNNGIEVKKLNADKNLDENTVGFTIGMNKE